MCSSTRGCMSLLADLLRILAVGWASRTTKVDDRPANLKTDGCIRVLLHVLVLGVGAHALADLPKPDAAGWASKTAKDDSDRPVNLKTGECMCVLFRVFVFGFTCPRRHTEMKVIKLHARS